VFDSGLASGDIIRSTYTIEALLGEGSFGAVYKVRHKLLGIQAMKVFRVTASGPSVEDVIAEALILSKLLDRHVVRIFEANTINDSPPERPYMTMEFFSGGTLESFLQRRVRLQPISALKTASQISGGLAAAHTQSPPIVHRDLKPQNVLIESISPNGTPQVKVADFGLAKHVDPDSRMVRAAGTLQYLAPEAAWGFSTPASDVYSLGIVLFRMLTGVFPFPVTPEGEIDSPGTARDALLRGHEAGVPPLSRFRLGLAPEIGEVVKKSLATAPEDRFRDGVELGQRLDDLIDALARGGDPGD
jgi:eukaryotic-like serine/threonine-protein kinase